MAFANDATIEIKKAVGTEEGEGAFVRRLFPTQDFNYLDPFILFDEFFVIPPAGFPDHPHRGFEVITYMRGGTFIHRDSMGNENIIKAGGVQRITTGRGIVHSEMPGTKGMNQGLQIWINLPKHLKGLEPSYQDIEPSKVPEHREGSVLVRTIVGEGSPVTLQTPVIYLAIEIGKYGSFKQRVPEEFNALIYLLQGSIGLSGITMSPFEGVVLKGGSEIQVTAHQHSKFIFLAGKPHNEMVMLRGSFVD